MELKSIHTRFRAYQLKTKGGSFSYWNGSQFILGEARYNDDNKNSIWHELKVCGKTSIDKLHITSWDADHCSCKDLELILKELKPKTIQYPGYDIDTSVQNQVESLKLIAEYEAKDSGIPKLVSIQRFDPPTISKLNPAQEWSYNNVIYNTKKDYPDSNNNSTVKKFRNGSFSVLSLGDLEKEEISKSLCSCPILKNEVDIMLLAHHGSDNGFTSDLFLDTLKPKVAISLCNYSNMHGHPDEAILKKLRDRKIEYYSTKQGDIIIESIDDHTKKYKVWNYISDGEKLKDEPKSFTTKRASKVSSVNLLNSLNKFMNK